MSQFICPSLLALKGDQGKKGIVIFQENTHVFLDDDYWLQNSNIPSNFVHEITS